MRSRAVAGGSLPPLSATSAAWKDRFKLDSHVQRQARALTGGCGLVGAALRRLRRLLVGLLLGHLLVHRLLAILALAPGGLQAGTNKGWATVGSGH